MLQTLAAWPEDPKSTLYSQVPFVESFSGTSPVRLLSIQAALTTEQAWFPAPVLTNLATNTTNLF
jgi:hypothetical protein